MTKTRKCYSCEEFLDDYEHSCACGEKICEDCFKEKPEHLKHRLQESEKTTRTLESSIYKTKGQLAEFETQLRRATDDARLYQGRYEGVVEAVGIMRGNKEETQ